MSEIAVAQMRNRMIKDTEGFLSKRLSVSPGQNSTLKEELVEYIRRFALRQGLTVDHQVLNEMTL